VTCLGKPGSEAAHVGDVGLLTAADRIILQDVAANDLVMVSADTGFGEMLGFANTIFGQAPGAVGRLSAAMAFRRSRGGE
jgi:predicted nuclease of predicted toxin-antitoxin system